ncbi:tetraspanin Tsp2 [Obba rivulosa]|uniref:Tetraspanin Tsp2 n=1 Tax=Obba rivulosa TaxID=1052685 RepID=A0A8E2AMR7_9APHY|nr:tetraspanin Tsp2 [Obba rivulosa]
MDDPAHSRTSSLNSHQSNAASTRHILAGMNNDANAPLEPPNLPFGSRNSSFRSLSPKNDNPFASDTKSMAPSLSVNYLPSKFSGTLLTGGPKRRKNWKGAADEMMPKRGGGREAFRSNEARMPGEGDDDYDGIDFGTREGGRTKPKLRWTRFKWALFVSNIIFTGYTLAGLIACLLIWFNVWTHADIIRVGNRTELIISTLAASLGVFTSLIGWSGILLNNRAFLAIYSFLLWIVFAFLVTPGYITYKKRTFNLEGKINAQWSRDLGLDGRLRIQNQLGCCGYFSPFVEATISQTCYARSLLPGCKAPYLAFERMVLERWYTVAFSLVPAQLIIMVTGLLSSNHVTYRFGKGMMPKAYRLNMNSMAVIMDNYANQLAEQYGNDVASEILARSRSNLQLDAMPTVPYSSSLSASSTYNGAKYDTINGKS